MKRMSGNPNSPYFNYKKTPPKSESPKSPKNQNKKYESTL